MTEDGSGKTTPPGDWWRSYFDGGYVNEYSPVFNLVTEREQVMRLMELMALPSGSRVLDLACGQGRHAHLLAEAGFDVDGLDLSKELLKRAKARGTSRKLRYTRGDMRSLPFLWRKRFDGVVNLFQSFGFFDDPADDARVIHEVARVLKPGAVFIWQGGNRDGLTERYLRGDEWTTSNGTRVSQTRTFDPLSGFLTVHSTWTQKRTVEQRVHRLRLYTATHLAALCADAGLQLEAAFDGFNVAPLTRRSHEMLIVARRPAPVRRVAR